MGLEAAVPPILREDAGAGPFALHVGVLLLLCERAWGLLETGANMGIFLGDRVKGRCG